MLPSTPYTAWDIRHLIIEGGENVQNLTVYLLVKKWTVMFYHPNESHESRAGYSFSLGC